MEQLLVTDNKDAEKRDRSASPQYYANNMNI